MRKILIADHEMDLLLMLEKRFTSAGYPVITAYNGNNALALAKSQLPDIIVLDSVLGGHARRRSRCEAEKKP